VLLILHWPEQNGIGQIHHFGNAAAGWPKKDPLRLGRAINDVFRRSEVLADQLRLVLIEGPLQVRGQEAVHDVHAGRQAELGHAAQDEGLVGGCWASLPMTMIQPVSSAP